MFRSIIKGGELFGVRAGSVDSHVIGLKGNLEDPDSIVEEYLKDKESNEVFGWVYKVYS